MCAYILHCDESICGSHAEHISPFSLALLSHDRRLGARREIRRRFPVEAAVFEAMEGEKGLDLSLDCDSEPEEL